MQMRIGRYDFPSQYLEGTEGILSEIERILLEGTSVLGPQVAMFESSFASYCQREFAVGVNSGTDALQMALDALDIGRGDEVITQANTFHSTVLAIVKAGATPVLVDVDPESWTMQPELCQEAITDKTKAILTVHMYGAMNDMAAIASIARSNGLVLIEDAAQAHGARLSGRRAGSWGDAGCFSFHPSKNLSAAGDAGAIVLNDGKLYEKLRQLRSLGQSTQNNHVELGYNSKLDSIQAIILSEKLNHLDKWNEERRVIADHYDRSLAMMNVFRPKAVPNSENVHHLYPILVDRRDEVLNKLREYGIDAVIRYPQMVANQPSFMSLALGDSSNYPVSASIAAGSLCLPLFPSMQLDQQDYISDVLSKLVE